MHTSLGHFETLLKNTRTSGSLARDMYLEVRLIFCPCSRCVYRDSKGPNTDHQMAYNDAPNFRENQDAKRTSVRDENELKSKAKTHSLTSALCTAPTFRPAAVPPVTLPYSSAMTTVCQGHARSRSTSRHRIAPTIP
eukprot:3025123-Amphidinium_carterae.1